MNQPKLTNWNKVKERIQDGFLIILYFLLSPIWALVFLLNLLRRFLITAGQAILSPLESLQKKASLSLNKLPKNSVYLILTLLLQTSYALLTSLILIIRVIFLVLPFLISITIFIPNLLYIVLGGSLKSEYSFYEGYLESLVTTKLSNERLRISIAFPTLLSKRFEGTFLFQIYSTDSRSAVARAIKAEFQNEQIVEQTASSKVQVGQNIKIKLFSPQINFSDPVIKTVNSEVTKFTFLGTPTDTCQAGFHKVLVSITDTESEKEIDSMTIKVNITDFAFDHVSKPLLSKVSSAILGISSVAMFTLALLEQIDKTIGVTSGTAAGVLATVIYANFFNLYQRIRSNTP